ncbi:MAG: DNA gyrase subunit A, partial [Verrucomicrobia bacterium]|nr:DNA gyrase subunit A [Verrucomicrobiota bacterium]
KGMEAREAQSKEDKNDFVETLFSANMHDFLLFFTNTGRVYVERVYQLPEAPRTGKGRSIKNVLNLGPEEKINSVLRLEAQGVEDEAMWSPEKFVLFATRDGTVKKTSLDAFKNYRKAGMIAINIEEGNDLVDVVLTDGKSNVCFVTHEGMCLQCEETDIRPVGRNSIGVRGIRLEEGDYLVSLTMVEPNKQLLVVSEKGLGKRTPFEEYRLINRGGKGVTTLNVTEKTGKVAAAMAVHDDDELMLITSKGQNVRIRVGGEKGIRETGRNAQGVKLMDLKKDETIQDVATVIADEEDEVSAEVSSDETTVAEVSTDESTEVTDTPADDSASEA